METHILSLDPILMIWDFLYKGSAVTLTPPAILKTFIDIIITQGQGKDKFTFCGISRADWRQSGHWDRFVSQRVTIM